MKIVFTKHAIEKFKNKREGMKVKYYKDADLLSLRVSNKPYYDATRGGDLIVHYTKSGEPVLVEILNASKFLKEAGETLPKKFFRAGFDHLSVAVPHRIR